MRRSLVLGCLVGVAACNSKQPAPKPQATAGVRADAAVDARAGSAGDPAWAKDPPEVLWAKINGVNAHVIVLKSAARFAEYRDVLAVVEKTRGVRAAAPFIFLEMEIEKAGRPPQQLSLKAVDPARVARVLTVGSHMKTGTFGSLAKGEPPPIVLGDVLARVLDAAVGDDVVVRPLKNGIDPAIPPTTFRVAGTFHMDFDVYDEQLGFAALPTVQAMLGRGDQVMGIEMTVDDLAQSDEVAQAVERALGGPPYQVMDWYELNKDLFSALGHRRP